MAPSQRYHSSHLPESQFEQGFNNQVLRNKLGITSVSEMDIHGIVLIENCRGEGSSPSSNSNSRRTTTQKQGGETPPLPRKITLGQVVAYFKYQSAKTINLIRNTPGSPIWQRNYYEHIIRDYKELHAIREYIKYTPTKWAEDKENPNMKRKQ